MCNNICKTFRFKTSPPMYTVRLWLIHSRHKSNCLNHPVSCMEGESPCHACQAARKRGRNLTVRPMMRGVPKAYAVS